MPFVSCRFAGETSIARGMPYLSTSTWILTPRIFFPPSMPRSKQLGAELAQRRSGQGWLWPRSHRPGTVLCHGLEFRQHFVHEHVNIDKRIPGARRRLCRTDGGSHVLASMLLVAEIGLDGCLSGHRRQFN